MSRGSIWRFADPPPPLEPTQFGRLLEIASRVSHWTLYALLVAVPFVGIVVNLKRGEALPIFGLWDFASPWPADRATARSALEAHELLANALLILAGIHAVRGADPSLCISGPHAGADAAGPFLTFIRL